MGQLIGWVGEFDRGQCVGVCLVKEKMDADHM